MAGKLETATVSTHTIILLQTSNKETRHYSQYSDLDEALMAICEFYERHLYDKSPDIPEISYTMNDLMEFLDILTDISCLVYHEPTNSYTPYNKSWIKEKLFLLMRRNKTEKEDDAKEEAMEDSS